MTERERNREIIEAWNPNILAFMDDLKKEFEGSRVVLLCCDVVKTND